MNSIYTLLAVAVAVAPKNLFYGNGYLKMLSLCDKKIHTISSYKPNAIKLGNFATKLADFNKHIFRALHVFLPTYKNPSGNTAHSNCQFGTKYI